MSVQHNHEAHLQSQQIPTLLFSQSSITDDFVLKLRLVDRLFKETISKVIYITNICEMCLPLGSML